ncbi:MAG: phosphotransferase [Alphaproteobacteria bacterium]|nr:MAG: phosphotransferase [Alphaproteobacteria bacterium]
MISALATDTPARPAASEAVEEFLTHHAWHMAERHPLAVTLNTLSVRRYTRLRRLDGASAMLMDCADGSAPPFVRIDHILREMGLSAPEIYAQDLASGLLLVEDFGDDTYAKILAAGGDLWPTYRTAVDVLIHLHRNFRIESAPDLLRYDLPVLIEQVSLFTQVFAVSASACKEFEDAWRAVLPITQSLPQSLLLRDYSASNLVRRAGKTGLAACGLLDFQDAGIGPVIYDLLSLVERNRNPAPTHLAQAARDYYLNTFPHLDRAAFEASWAILSTQRRMRVLALFTLYMRQGRAELRDVLPGIKARMHNELRHPALSPVAQWVSQHEASFA